MEDDAVVNGEESRENANDLERTTVDELKQAIADLIADTNKRLPHPGAQKLGNALRMLMVPHVDQERRLEALLAVLLKPDASVEDFGRAFGMPIVPGADRESQERFLEGSSTLLVGFLDGVVDLRQHLSTKHDNPPPSPGARAPVASKDVIPLQTEIDWRTSEGHQQLLLYFASGSSVDEIRTKLNWEGILGESFDSAISRFKACGALVLLNQPKWHILYRRRAEELVELCGDHGLNAFGTKEELAERLVSVDPSGSKLGYPGELLTCSRETRRILAYASRQPRADDTVDDTAAQQEWDPFASQDEGASGPKQLDLRKPECPYCHKVLAKVPGRKTKCPNCGEFMFVRTRPVDGARVVVTKADADVIEEDWSIVGNADEPDFHNPTSRMAPQVVSVRVDVIKADACVIVHGPIVTKADERDTIYPRTSRKEVEEEREKLRQSVRGVGQQEPSDDEVKWSLLNKWSTRQAAAKEWGAYKRMELSKAAFLTRRCKFSDALRHYLYVCALDLNGATSKALDTHSGRLEPYILDQVTRIFRKLRLRREEIGNLFRSCYAERALPLPVDECWAYLQNALWPSASSLREDVPVPGEPCLIYQVLALPCGMRTISRIRSLLPENLTER